MQLNPRQTASQAAKRIVRRRRSARMTIQSCRLHVQAGPARPRCEARSLLGVVRAARSASLRVCLGGEDLVRLTRVVARRERQAQREARHLVPHPGLGEASQAAEEEQELRRR